MTRPLVKPIRPEFSSGPCAKRPKWSLKFLNNSILGRSHRHKIAKSKLQELIDLTKLILIQWMLTLGEGFIPSPTPSRGLDLGVHRIVKSPFSTQNRHLRIIDFL